MNVLSVLVLGFLGGVIRFACGDTWSSTLILNAVGAVTLGVLSILWRAIRVKPWMVIGINAGFIGSFTTFSSLMFNTIHLYSVHTLDAVESMVVTLGSILLSAVGMGFAQHSCRRMGLEEQSCNNQQSS
jgi:CrcB protein